VMAARPFTARTTLDRSLWDVREQSGTQEVALRERCAPSVMSAWKKSRADGTWAVTVGTNMQGDAGGSITGLCRQDARRRLSWAAGLGVLTAGTVIAGRLRKATRTREI
ncbi:MAG: hypothetical protein ACRDHY_17960, partial [Anaerolineales bacterium]